ncbi:AMP-binding protein [Paracoccus sp. WLY502]|uniref:AMP-binding protein n=1 Tax=Paracoccus yibinensis TaxID=3068891 RepID=UPI0027966954|nr:AMP-binding protein [Paracoccus sp. WLY502]MDQ1902541.1 AMP-binding protein [Paracoccus sp. WLY502]
MLDLGTSFLAAVSRDPKALAIVDGDVRLTYEEWYGRISALVSYLDGLGVKKGDHVVTVLQNRWENASLHWAAQFAGLIITPINWRATAEDLSHALTDSQAKLLIFDDVAGDAVAACPEAATVQCLTLRDLQEALARTAPPAQPRADADCISLMLYTSGTTSKPKGVPRRHRTERAAAVAHIAQNLYAYKERTLGVMPLYHTMGVRSLLAHALINGTFVCLPRFSVSSALALIENERITNLYLVPTLYHDLVHHPDFSPDRVRSVRKLGYAGAPMTDGLTAQLDRLFQPDLFVNHYGSSEVYTFSIDQSAACKPGSAGKAGLNQIIRVIRLDAGDVHSLAAPREEGQIIALLQGDEAFEGYWRRPDADRKALRDGWYLTGDTGFFDEDGDLFVTGRVDDMIITGGENVSPVEVESCLSLHRLVDEVAVVGLPDERWGKVVTAFIRRRDPSLTPEMLDEHCKHSGLANFRRPRSYVFVHEIPRSPVGKLLRRCLVAGEYEPEKLPTIA